MRFAFTTIWTQVHEKIDGGTAEWHVRAMANFLGCFLMLFPLFINVLPMFFIRIAITYGSFPKFMAWELFDEIRYAGNLLIS